jgi:hypothetical protein
VSRPISVLAADAPNALTAIGAAQAAARTAAWASAGDTYASGFVLSRSARSLQMFALTSVNSRLHCWNLRNLAICCCALRTAAALARLSERVLPLTL